MFNNELPGRYPRKSKTSFLEGFLDDDDADGDEGDSETIVSAHSSGNKKHSSIQRRFCNLFELDLSLLCLPNQLEIELDNVSPGSTSEYSSGKPLTGDSISVLNLSNCEFGGADLLKNISLPRFLTKLNLSFTEIESLNDIVSLPKLNRLLVLECTSCTCLSGPLDASLCLPDSLRVLTLSHCSALFGASPSTDPVIKLNSLKNLKVLSLTNTNFSDSYFVGGNGDFFPPNLEVLDLSMTNVGKSTEATPARVFPDTLRTLRLYRCRLLTNSSTILKCLPKGLKEFDVSACANITDLGEDLPASITSLDIASTNIVKLPILPNLIFLEGNYCERLQDISNLLHSRVEEMELIQCTSLKNPSITLHLKHLKCLTINGCKEITKEMHDMFQQKCQSSWFR